jgi:lipopolysaccharide export system protein LptA
MTPARPEPTGRKNRSQSLLVGLFALGLWVVGLLSPLTGYGQSQAIVDYDARRGQSIPMGDSTAMQLVNEVVIHHNGAILTCDSAILYNRNYIECFGRVTINRDSAYVYGDRVDFNGITNLATVYAPIVKTVDGDMTMYSRTMEFNTLTKIGRFSGGGTISQKDNLIEAVEGIYHVDERDIYFVGKVEMRNEEYLIQSDSMGYNFNSEVSTFYRPARIWNKDGDFLSADRGYYDRLNDVYHFLQNSYVLTKDQEIFADTILYMKTAGIVSVSGDAQIHDREQKAYIWGDYGVYWFEDQQAVMSEDPSAMGYDDQAESPDSVWIRGDRLMMHTFPSEWEFTEELAASLVLPRRDQLDSLRLAHELVSTLPRPDSLMPDSLSNWGHLYGAEADSTLLVQGMRGAEPDSTGNMPLVLTEGEFLPDSLGRGVLLPDSLTALPIRPDTGYILSNRPEIPLDAHPPQEQAERPDGVVSPPDSVATGLPPNDPAVKKTKSKRQIRRELRLERRKAQMREYAIEQGILRPDSLPPVDSLLTDSIPAVDSLPPAPAVDTIPRDSLQRVFRAFRNVRIFRSDTQAVCDSLEAFSIDSTAHLYVRPVLWNETNQVTAESIHIFSFEEQLRQADFEGNPVMSQWVLDSLFNQVTGDRMEAFFEENNIRRLDVLENAKSYYYTQEENKPDEIGGFIDLKAKNIVFVFDDSMRISRIAAYVNPESALYPMDKIPETHTQRFPNFEWLPGLRPRSRWDICERELRPSVRQESESIPYPQFRITEQIEADKKRYIEQGIWTDRNDTIRIDPSFFLNITD